MSAPFRATKDAKTWKRPPLRFSDFFWPRKDALARWSLQLGAQLVGAFGDQYSPLNLPLSLSMNLVAYDDVKRFRWRPFVLFLTFEENGRADAYDTVSYGFNIFDVDLAVHVHPWVHFYYQISVLQSGGEFHVTDAALTFRVGARIPLWFVHPKPALYDLNHLHIVIMPLSVSALGRLGRDTLKGFNRVLPSLNGHLGIEWAIAPLSWMRVHAQVYFHLNFNLEQTSLLRGRAGVDFVLHPQVLLRLEMLGQWYPKAPQIRSNLYSLYFLQFPAMGGGITLDIRFARWAGGKR